MTNHNSPKTIEDVRKFWESNPLWTGESLYQQGSIEYFEEHSNATKKDCFAGKIDERIFPRSDRRARVLDLGCGPGFWTIELFRNGCEDLIAVDLTSSAINLTKKRCVEYNVDAWFSQQNAERLAFKDESFSHVNCHGVIHHTPNPNFCLHEIARILKPEGTASISVYYKNIILRLWPVINILGKLLSNAGTGLKGRGRENICSVSDPDEIVRLYDGKNNPIGVSFGNEELKNLVQKDFQIQSIFYHFFPARAFPFSLPKQLHKMLDRKLGFMVYANLIKR